MDPIVETVSGKLSGATSNGVHAFKGIPYGTPTGGERRFKPARPRAPWNGVLDARSYGPTCPQVAGPARPAGRLPEPEVASGEDCLVLNVWTRHLDSSSRRPVMVWFHGGGFFTGSGSRPVYDGTNLARQQDVVVVTLNHRLGALGYLYLADIAGGDYAASGNVGNLDLVLALEWVRDNIARFGGDPSNITIFGHSGGAAKVSDVMVMPAAEGLFHRAIMQSGATATSLPSTEATRKACELLRLLDLDEHHIDELHTLPIERLLEAQWQLQLASPRGIGMGFSPVVDGTCLPLHPLAAFSSGMASNVPLMLGTTQHEVTAFTWIMQDADSIDEVTLRQRLRQHVGPVADGLVDAYRAAAPGQSNRDLWVSLMTDQMMGIPHFRVAEVKATRGSAPVYNYLITYAGGPSAAVFGATHGVELSLVFANPMPGYREDAGQLMRAMSNAWASFARTGDPHHPGLPEWPAYTPTDRSVMVFDTDCRLVAAPRRAEYEAWADVDGASVGVIA